MTRPLRVLLAPNSFKGCASAESATEALWDGVRAFCRMVNIEYEARPLPICDGGTGFSTILAKAWRPEARLLEAECCDPLGRKLIGRYALTDDGTAIIESAETIGLALLKKAERNPMNTSSFGLGEMIKQAIEQGARRLLVGCGDSATTDAGIGMLAGLGTLFYSKGGDHIARPLGRDIESIVDMDHSANVLLDFDGEVEVACNLSSIARGAGSTALVYAEQKGASQAEARQLAGALERACLLLERTRNRPDLGLLPGSGAAGGVGFGLALISSNCRLRYSFEVVFEAIDLDRQLRWADVVITGEGLFDRNSVKGKAPVALALRGRCERVVVIGVVGAREAGIHSRILRSGFHRIEAFSDCDPSEEHFIRDFHRLASDATINALEATWDKIRSKF